MERMDPRRAWGVTAACWIATWLFALQMGFTAYARIRLPQVAEGYTRHQVQTA